MQTDDEARDSVAPKQTSRSFDSLVVDATANEKSDVILVVPYGKSAKIKSIDLSGIFFINSKQSPHQSSMFFISLSLIKL